MWASCSCTSHSLYRLCFVLAFWTFLCLAGLLPPHYPSIVLLHCCSILLVSPHVCLYIPCTFGIITLKYSNLFLSEPLNECETLFRLLRKTVLFTVLFLPPFRWRCTANKLTKKTCSIILARDEQIIIFLPIINQLTINLMYLAFDTTFLLLLCLMVLKQGKQVLQCVWVGRVEVVMPLAAQGNTADVVWPSDPELLVASACL